MEDRTKFTLDDWSAMQRASSRLAAARIYEDIMQPNALAEALFAGYKSPTKWQRRKMRIKEFFGRFYLAWRALRGDDLSFED